MNTISPSRLPFHLDQAKIKFKPRIFSSPNHKVISNEAVTIGPGADQDLNKKIVAIKAPVVRIQSLINATQKLVIHTDLLVINGGYVTKPEQWDIQAEAVRFKNVNEQSQWLSQLIQDGAINSQTFNSQSEPDCNFDIPPKPSLDDRITDFKDEIKDMKNKLKNWLSR